MRYLYFGICVSVYTNTYKDIKKGLGARACLFLLLLFAFFELYSTDLQPQSALTNPGNSHWL